MIFLFLAPVFTFSLIMPRIRHLYINSFLNIEINTDIGSIVTGDLINKEKKKQIKSYSAREEKKIVFEKKKRRTDRWMHKIT